MNSRIVWLFMLIGLVCLMNACGVAEGPAFLRIEGKVVNQDGHPVIGKAIQICLQPEDLDRTPKPSEGNSSAQPNINGQFLVEKSRFAGGLLIMPMALVVMPISGLVAAATPWTHWDVQEFFSPAYLIGSDSLPHPEEIKVFIGLSEQPINFAQEEIRKNQYRGKDRSHGKSCTRLYNLGELKILSSQVSK